MNDIKRGIVQPALVEAPFRSLEELVLEGFLRIHVARLVSFRCFNFVQLHFADT